MLIESFDWDEHNEMHIARHHVLPDEVEQIFDRKYYWKKAKDGKYFSLGQTDSGRCLAVVCVLQFKGRVRIVTAREMDNKELRFYKKWRGAWKP